MPLKDPKQLLAEFFRAREKLSNATKPMSESELHQIADDLSDVYNYVSGTTQETSLVNVMHSRSAHDARVAKELESAEAHLEKQRKFVKELVADTETYLRTVHTIGYATIVAMLTLTKGSIGAVQWAAALLLTIVSAAVVVSWEIFRSVLVAWLLREHARLVRSGSIFLRDRASAFQSAQSVTELIGRVRVWVFLASVLPAFAAVVLLAIAIVGQAFNAHS